MENKKDLDEYYYAFDFDEIKDYYSWLTDREANNWANFYLSFNDDNIDHMYQSFYSQDWGIDFKKDLKGNHRAPEIIHEANLNWVREILKRNVSKEEMIKIMPDSEPYIKEVLGE